MSECFFSTARFSVVHACVCACVCVFRYFAFFGQCANPKACTVLLRGGSKDVLNEIERNLQDAMQVVRNVVLEPRLLPGGGATEMAVSNAIRRQLPQIEGVKKFACEAVANALEVIPRTLAQNCGGNVVRVLTELRAKHTQGTDGKLWAINGVTGEIVDSDRLGVWEPFAVKVQTLKTSIEVIFFFCVFVALIFLHESHRLFLRRICRARASFSASTTLCRA